MKYSEHVAAASARSQETSCIYLLNAKSIPIEPDARKSDRKKQEAGGGAKNAIIFPLEYLFLRINQYSASLAPRLSSRAHPTPSTCFPVPSRPDPPAVHRAITSRICCNEHATGSEGPGIDEAGENIAPLRSSASLLRLQPTGETLDSELPWEGGSRDKLARATVGNNRAEDVDDVSLLNETLS